MAIPTREQRLAAALAVHDERTLETLPLSVRHWVETGEELSLGVNTTRSRVANLLAAREASASDTGKTPDGLLVALACTSSAQYAITQNPATEGMMVKNRSALLARFAELRGEIAERTRERDEARAALATETSNANAYAHERDEWKRMANKHNRMSGNAHDLATELSHEVVRLRAELETLPRYPFPSPCPHGASLIVVCERCHDESIEALATLARTVEQKQDVIDFHAAETGELLGYADYDDVKLVDALIRASDNDPAECINMNMCECHKERRAIRTALLARLSSYSKGVAALHDDVEDRLP